MPAGSVSTSTLGRSLKFGSLEEPARELQKEKKPGNFLQGFD
jgi:hypothetical protein